MMEITNTDLLDIDLATGSVFRSFTQRLIAEGDIKSHVYGVRCFRKGQAVNLTGYSVTGYFVRADGKTFVLDGEVSGNKAYVSLSRACYAVVGAFTLAVKVVGGGVNGAMRIVDGTVTDTTTSSVVDPAGTVPDIAALMAVIERAEAAAEAIAAFSVYTELNSGTDYRLVVEVEEDDS